VVRLERESEKRRPLRNYSCRLSPELSYRSVQEFRKDVAIARTLVPPGAAATLDVIKRAAELFSDRYEDLARRAATTYDAAGGRLMQKSWGACSPLCDRLQCPLGTASWALRHPRRSTSV
jgi:hypothetical protein